MAGIWRGLAVLLAPWPALVLGVLALSLAQWAVAQASGAELVQRLAGDALMLVRVLPLWCVLTLPVLLLPVRARAGVQALLGTVFLLVLLALDLYFATAGVALGADVFAYSWQELRTTVSAAQVALPWPQALALVLAVLVLWGHVWRGLRSAVPEPANASPSPRHAGVLAACLLGSALLPTGVPGASARASNKLQFWLGDVLAAQPASPAQVAAAGDSAFPFEHAETTPDTLGPLLELDAKTPPHLVFLIVEGLGRSFSGPGAALGSFTPFLDELAGRSLYWDNFVAAQGRTFAVLPSVLGSLPFAPYGERAIAHDNLLSLLKGQGYRLRYFSGTNLAFDHQGDFLAQSGVQSFWSEPDYRAPAQKLSEWGYPDGDVLQALLAQGLPATPSLTVLQTMSMHTPFVVPRMAHYRAQVAARLDALGVPQAQRQAYVQQQDIYASILYTDEVLKGFFAQVAQRPEWRNTVFVITGDHRLPEIPMATRLERYHVPLIVYSPLLRAPRRIQALSSHFDIAPSVLAMLAHRYGWATPQRVHWMGTGLDVHPQWRNLHSLPLKQTKTELSDYISGEYYLAQDRVFSLQAGLKAEPDAQSEPSGLAQGLRAEFADLRAHVAQLAQADALVAVPHRSAQPYAEAGRTLQPERRARQMQGVVVGEARGQFDAQGRLSAQAVFSLQGQVDSPVFVPLLVLSDAQGQELAEASGPAMRLQAGQSQTVALSLSGKDLPQVPAGRYFLSMIVSHPDTGKPIGKGQYHVPVDR